MSSANIEVSAAHPKTGIEVSAMHPKTGGSRALDWIFGHIFRGLIYNQAWEYPLVDLAMLSLNADHRIVTIGSAGCNAPAYLSADVKRIDAVDINAAHRAFSLKRTALERLPDRDAMFRMFGDGQIPENVRAYGTLLAPHLPQPARAYWSGRGMTGKRRISMSSRVATAQSTTKQFPCIWKRPCMTRSSRAPGASICTQRWLTDCLKTQSSGAVHRFVLLDAQDWMSPQDVATLWSEIERTAHPEAPVLFRTAGPFNPFHSLPEELRRAWTARDDRTALHSGVHLIERRSAKGGI